MLLEDFASLHVRRLVSKEGRDRDFYKLNISDLKSLSDWEGGAVLSLEATGAG